MTIDELTADERSIERTTDVADGPTRNEPEATAGDDGGARRTEDPPEGPMRPPLLPWILAIIGLVGTVGFGLAWRAESSSSDGATAASQVGVDSEMAQAARGFAESLTNFDGATIDRDFDRITARSAGEFRSQADQFFSTEVRAELKEAQASSRGEIRSAYVQTDEGDRGTVFVVVDQTIANNRSPQPQSDTLRMELGMVRRDGEWKVERVAVLTAPSGASTLAPAEGN